MIKALIRTAMLVVAVLVLSRFIPLLAEHEQAALIAVVAIGLIGIITRVLVVVLILAALVMFFHPFF